MIRGAALLSAALTVSSCEALRTPVERAVNRTAASEDELLVDLAACDRCDEIRDWFIADLHADTLLWGRDPLIVSSTGHIDLHRLREAGVDLQVFSVPTRTPLARRLSGQTVNPDGSRPECVSEGDFNLSAALFAVTGAPPRTWTSDRARALEQAGRFCTMTEGNWTGRRCVYPDNRAPHADAFFAITNGDDLARLEAAIADTPPDMPRPVGAMLSLEGLHWIPQGATAADVEAEVAALADAGFRMVGLVHRFTNNLAGSEEDCDNAVGLVPGRGDRAVEAMFARGIIVDVAHMSAAAVNATLDLWERHREGRDDPPRLVMSHGGVRQPGCLWNERNLDDDTVTRLMLTGVPFGMIQWDRAMCVPGSDVQVLDARIDGAYAHALSLAQAAGEPEAALRTLALGIDLDGAVRVPRDVRGVPLTLSRLAESTWCKKPRSNRLRRSLARHCWPERASLSARGAS